MGTIKIMVKNNFKKTIKPELFLKLNEIHLFKASEIIPNQNSPSRIFINETTTSILSHANVS